MFLSYFQISKHRGRLTRDWLGHTPRGHFVVWRKPPIQVQLDSWGPCLETGVTYSGQATSHCARMAAVLKLTAKNVKMRRERDRLNTLIQWELHSSPESTCP